MSYNHYIILPAVIRYDGRLSFGARILYGEIKALSNKHGFCFATNGWFADRYDVTDVTVSNWISNLKKYKYIDISYIPHRRIFVPKLNENKNKTKIPIQPNGI